MLTSRLFHPAGLAVLVHQCFSKCQQRPNALTLLNANKCQLSLCGSHSWICCFHRFRVLWSLATLKQERRRRAAWIFPVWGGAAAGARTGREVRRLFFFVTQQMLGGARWLRAFSGSVTAEGGRTCAVSASRRSAQRFSVKRAVKGQREGYPTFIIVTVIRLWSWRNYFLGFCQSSEIRTFVSCYCKPKRTVLCFVT